ncbi:MAG TPA: UDP-N-acetylglucosamine 2-epimerase (non-hydrolyzing) [Thermodesulfobacteriota bacterium]
MKILCVVGARPNFMKIAPITDELKKMGVAHKMVHTGQHYDYRMARLFFEDLGLPKPDINLNVGSGTHAVQTAEVMTRLDPVLSSESPSLVIVVGDVNSTMAATITAVKRGIPVAHVEAGLRSFDRTMPEEINRMLTDSIADMHFTTEQSANDNLVREGIDPSRIVFVGNTMIDTLLKHVDRASTSPILEDLGIRPREYGVATLHRPSNVDSRENLESILAALNEIAVDLPVIFPAHPRTKKLIADFNLGHLVMEAAENRHSGVHMIEPLGYLDFLKLMREARIVFTDSGGIQEETTVLELPCLTLRENTERPITITAGTNTLVGTDRNKIVTEARRRLDQGFVHLDARPPLWDGRAAERIVAAIFSRVGGAAYQSAGQ